MKLKTDQIIVVLYAIPFFVCLRTFLLSVEVYEHLPNKIPMHFNMKGKADKWWNKNRFAVYLMPGICALTLAIFVAILILIHHDSGPLPDDFALAFLLFTFSLVLLLHQTQVGIIRYALQEIKNIWKTIWLGFLLLLLACASLVVTGMPGVTPRISEAVICSKVEAERPVGIRNEFHHI